VSIRSSLGRLFKSSDELDLTSGTIAKPLLLLSFPIIVTNTFQTAYNLADTFWLGQYNTTALAAISFAFPMVFLLISLALGISVAGSVLVAQHIGADQEQKAEFAASQTVSFSIIVSIILGGIGYFLVDEYLVLLGASESVVPVATAYMQIISIGLFAMFGFAVFIALMRGYGDTVTPMLVMFGSVVLNIILDPILIFGFENNPLFGYLGLRGLETALFGLTGFTGAGIEGAAIATVFSRILALVVGLAIMFRGERGVQIHLDQMVPDLEYARRLIDIGVPASVESTGIALSTNVLLFIIAAFPASVVAAYGIGTRVFSVIFLPAIAFSQGVETMTGQNIGAGKEDRAKRTNHFSAKVMLVALTALGAIVFFAARPIAAVFTTDPAVVDTAATFMKYTALTFGGIGVRRAYTGGFRGAGKTIVAAVIAVAILGVVRLPVAWVGADLLGPSGVWIAFAVSNIGGGIVSYLWFRRGTWRGDDLTETRTPTMAETPTDD
jgi:putative MATE family efflux protein